MVSTVKNLIFPVLLAFAAAVAFVCPALATGSFQAKFTNPPSFISPYDEPNYTFSAAIGPRPLPMLSTQRKLRPQVVRSKFSDSTITFNTEYYKGRGVTKDMIPVAVDAGEFYAYRVQKNTNEMFFEEANKTIISPDAAGRAEGLGLRLALPKRLDRIFGEGGAGLKVTGFRKITFSGTSQWTDAANTDTYNQSKFPSLNMEQISRFDITGTIGSKISVKVSQDSQTDIPLSNRIQIRYKGDEDDVLKAIEAGNTTLNVPNTRFVGYSSQISGLFGLKAEAQLGSLKLTAIASQEKGSSESASFTPTGETGAKFVRDYEFAAGRIFDLGLPGEIGPKDSVVTLYVYEQENRDDNIEARFARLLPLPEEPDEYSDEKITGIRVNTLERDKYQFYNDPDRNLHYVVFSSTRSPYKALGVWMTVLRDGQSIPDTIGNISGDTLELKLLRHNNAVNTHATWGLMWRNCYSIPKNSEVEDLDVKIYKGLPGAEQGNSVFDYQEGAGGTMKYLEILGLDQYNTRNVRDPDGRMDDRTEIFRPDDWGLLIFPHRRPFASDTTFVDTVGNETQELQVKTPDIYEYTDVQKADASQYYIQMATITRGSIINLQKANIIENSERISVGGQLLKKGSDYQIDYDFGRITLLSEKAIDPNADISIDYEYAPFLAVQKKTLLGTRLEYLHSNDFEIGTTLLYKSDKAQDRKPRVGQETAVSFVYDVDASLKLHPNFLTTVADALPFVETESPSNLNLQGEIAQSRPNPNVEGQAWVDDFESAVDQLSLGTSRTIWQLSSEPYQFSQNAEDDHIRGKILWHTPRNFPNVEDVYDREAAQGQGSMRTFRMIFRPKYEQTDSVGVTTQSDKSWAGVTRYFNSRVDASRVQLFEFRSRGSKRAKVHFDFGRISEDVNGDEAASSEDKDLNGAVDELEDTGVDGLEDALEPGYDADTLPDPAGDNWYFDGEGKCPLPTAECLALNWDDESVRYEWLNGTEGNINDASVLGRPDEEQMSSNNFELANTYFSFEVDLANDSFLVEGSEWPIGDANPWQTYRIPLRELDALDESVSSGGGIPSWSEISHVRVWFEYDDHEEAWDTLEIADWYFVQANWRDTVVYDPRSLEQTEEQRTKFVVASISQEDGTFDPPSGVDAYTDPASNVTEAQRGLLLQYTNLNDLDSCMAVKDLLTVEQYSGYGKLEMYIHGEDDIDPGVGADAKMTFFFRIGQDSSSYYEYRTGIFPGWDDRNYMVMDFNEMTALKDSLQKANPDVSTTQLYGGNDKYRIKGNPNLNQIRQFTAGIVNEAEGELLSGEVWLDELRVTDVRKDIGTAGRVSGSGNIADLITYGFSFQSQDPYFRGISSATRGGSDNNLGSGKTQTTQGYNMSMKVDRFLPRVWGANVPVSYTYSKSTTTPLLRNNSDILLPEDVREEEKSVSESKSFTVSESFNHKGNNPLFKLLLNRLKNSVSYRRSSSRSVTTPYNYGENLSVKSSFDLGITKAPSIPIFFWTKPIPIARRASESRLGLYPSSWQLSGNFSRNISITDDVNLNRRSSTSRNLNANMRVDYRVFENLNLGFNVSTKRDLSDLDSVNVSFKNLRLGLETSYDQNFSASYDPRLFGFLTTKLSYKSIYGDDYDKSSNSRYSNLSRSWDVNGQFDHIALFGGKSSGGGRSSGRGRRNVRGGGGQKKEGGKPFYDPPLAVLRFLTGWVQPVTYTYGESYNNSLPGMAERPGLGYRFGLTRDAEVPIASQTRSPTSGEGESYSLTSGFSFLGGIVTDIKYRTSVSRDLVSVGSRLESRSTNWPDLTIRIQKFKTLPLIKPVVNKFIDVFSPRTGYSRSTRESKDLDGGFTTSRVVSIAQNPLLSVNFKLLRSLSLSLSYTRDEDETEKFNVNSGVLESITRKNSKGVTASTKYSFTAPGGIGLPIFGRVKFKSQVSITFDVKFNSTTSETSTSGKPFATSTDKDDFTARLQISYTFSSKIKGGMSGRWQDSSDNYRNTKRHVRELRIFTEIRF